MTIYLELILTNKLLKKSDDFFPTSNLNRGHLND